MLILQAVRYDSTLSLLSQSSRDLIEINVSYIGQGVLGLHLAVGFTVVIRAKSGSNIVTPAPSKGDTQGSGRSG